MSKNNDLEMYPLSFDVAGYMAEVKDCVNIALDPLSGHMHDVICTAISQCSEAANIMILEAQKNVKEISREITNTEATIEVGVDEGAIGGGEQGFVRVMVTLHGNHSVWARPGASAWTKHVGVKRQNHVEVEYHLPFFEQGDHSDVMLKAFEHDIQKYVKQFMASLNAMLQAIDYQKYLKIG